MSDRPLPLPAAPAPRDVVEIVDRLSSARVSATVESADEKRAPRAARFENATSVPGEAPVRWHDGDTALQAVSRLERLDETSVNCQLAPAPEWEPAPVRQSLRAPVDNSPMLVRIVESSALAKGRSVHVVCLDISASGCRASWPGPAPTSAMRSRSPGTLATGAPRPNRAGSRHASCASSRVRSAHGRLASASRSPIEPRARARARVVPGLAARAPPTPDRRSLRLSPAPVALSGSGRSSPLLRNSRIEGAVRRTASRVWRTPLREVQARRGTARARAMAPMRPRGFV